MYDVNAAPRPIVHASHSITQPAMLSGIQTGCIHHGPIASAWATTVTDVITVKPSSRSSVGEDDAPGCWPRSRAPRRPETAANPAVHTSAANASRNGSASSSGMPTIVMIRTIVSRISAGTCVFPGAWLHTVVVAHVAVTPGHLFQGTILVRRGMEQW